MNSKTQIVPFQISELGSAYPSTAVSDPGFGPGRIMDQSLTGSARVQSELSHPSERLHRKFLEGGFYIKPFLGALTATEDILHL